MARLGATALTRTPRGGRLHGRAPGEGHDAGLGRGVVGLARLGPPADDRGVVDDGARPPGDMCRSAARVQRKVPFSVTSSTSVPLLVGHVDELGRPAQPRVVDDHVEAAELGHGGGEEVLDRRPRRSRRTARRAGARPSPPPAARRPRPAGARGGR